jgi:Icc protein
MIRIVQISDCHLYADTNISKFAQINPYQSLARVLRDIAQYQLDLLLVTGDLSGDGSALSYQHFKQLIKESGITCPYVILPGNHDDLDKLQEQFEVENLWLAYPSESPLTLANWQIHLLNTKTLGSSGAFLQHDLQQLEKMLINATEHFQLIAAHHHPLPCHAWMDKHGWQNASDFVTLLSRYPRVKAMVYGHIHHASEQQRGDCCFMSCPSTCWQWAMQAQFCLSPQQAGYRLLELAASGTIFTKIIRVK